MSLQDVALKTEYRSLHDDIAHGFYIPLLKNAIKYKRAVGFFSSTVLAMITDGVYELYKNGGKIEILASPKLSDDDIKAIKLGYDNRQAIIKDALIRELQDYDDFRSRDQLNLLANLIAEGRLDIKIVEPMLKNGFGMYHEKVGLIEDDYDNVVAFSGSMNESYNALENNYESFDVFCSWKKADQARVKSKEDAFFKLWHDLDSQAKVYDFQNIKDIIVDKYRIGPIVSDVDEISLTSPTEKDKSADSLAVSAEVTSQKLGFIKPTWLELYDYQKEAIQSWQEHGYRGIFDMATGTGKTLTGLSALAKLSSVSDKLAVIIVCPYQHLVDQWVEDIVKFSVKPIIGHSSSPQRDYKKRLKKAVFNFKLGVINFFCFICTNTTFASKVIQKEIAQLTEYSVLVVDEAHNFGADTLKQTLKNDFAYRLALSATLERHNDPAGTSELYSFFGDVCIHYDLARAIKEEKLVPYNYYPIVVYLTDDELEQYYQLTSEIGKGIYKRNGKLIVTQQAKTLLLKRARLIAGANNKLNKLRELMEDYKDKNDLLIYCGTAKVTDDYISEELRQIDYISRMLNFDFNMLTAQFTSKESESERQIRIAEFKDKEIQALVAIKCLDEGVNIPCIQTAFILASTTNPKEYIQRRGRVLRKYPGKEYADIYDFITLPRPLDTVVNTDFNIAKREIALVNNELSRITEFQKLALNFYEVDHLLWDIKSAYKLFETIDELVDETEERDEKL